MKNSKLAVIALASLTLAQSSAFAAAGESFGRQSGCSSLYEHKLQLIAKHHDRREFAKGAASVVAGVGAGMVLIGMWTSPITEVQVMVSGGPEVIGYGVYNLVNHFAEKLDREDTLTQAYGMITSAAVSEDDLKNFNFEKRVVSEVERVNYHRQSLGMPALNSSEIDELRKTIPYGQRDKTVIDALIKSIQSDTYTPAYETVRKVVLDLSEKEELCPVKKSGKNDGKRRLFGIEQLTAEVKKAVMR